MGIKRLWKTVDFGILLVCLSLFIIGIVALYSANGGANGDPTEAGKQLIWFGVGVVFLIILASIDYEVLGKLWIPFYAIMLLMLFLVLFTVPNNRRN